MTSDKGATEGEKPALLVLASTYPRWDGDPEPGFVHELARRLTMRFRVTVLCPRAPSARRRETVDAVRVIRYPYAPRCLETLVNDGGVLANLKRARWKYILVPSFVLAQIWFAWRLVRRKKVDVIHAHWLLPQGLVAALLRRLPGPTVPFVVTSHGADLYGLKGSVLDRIKAFVVRRSAAATVVSSAMADYLVRLAQSALKVSVMPMGVDFCTRFTPGQGASPRSSRELLFVGRLVEKKGLVHLLNAMPAVLSKLPGVSLSIVGFGPEEAALKAQIARLGLAQNVRFLGAVSQKDLPGLYRRAALFVAPFVEAGSGDQEGLGLVVVEAVGCGCPVLVGQIPAVKDVLGSEFEDLMVDARNQAALAVRIVGTLQGHEKALERAAALRSTLASKFDWASVASAYAELLTETISTR